MLDTAVLDLLPAIARCQHLAERAGAIGRIVGREEEAGPAMLNQLAMPANV